MATRFYVNSGGTPALSSLGFDINLWERTTDAVRLPMNITKQNSALTTNAKQAGSTNANWDVCHYQFQSGSLPSAGTLSGTFKAWFQAIESSTNANSYPQVSIRVVSVDGSTVRGTAYSGGVQTAASSTVEFDSTSTYQAQRFPDSRDSNTLTNVSYQAGDIIIVEIGIRHLGAGGTTQSATIRIGDATANSDLAETQNGTTLGDPWIEFSQDIFPTAISGTDTGSGNENTSRIGLTLASGIVDQSVIGVFLVGQSTNGESVAGVDVATLVNVNVAELAHVTETSNAMVPPADTDVGHGVDTVTRISLNAVEIGASVDAIGSVTVIKVESGTASDTATQIAVSDSEVGIGADATSRIGLTVNESGTALDSASVQVVGGTISKSDGETATGGDTVAGIALSTAQSGSASDSPSVSPIINVSETGIAAEAFSTVGLSGIGELATAHEDAFIQDLGNVTPNVSQSAAVSDRATLINVTVGESAAGSDAITFVRVSVAEAAGIAESGQLRLTVVQVAVAADAAQGVSQGANPQVAELAHVVDSASSSVLVTETAHVTENLSIPIWGPLSDAVVATSYIPTVAILVTAGHTSVALVTAGHTSVSVVGGLPTTAHAIPLLTTHVTLTNNGATLLRVFRPGQIIVGQELFLSATAIKLIRRAEHREKALAMRREKEKGRDNEEKQLVGASPSSSPSLRGTGKLVRGPKQ